MSLSSTEYLLKERQKQSREIHDGSAQTVSAMRWRFQLLQRRLIQQGFDIKETKDLEMLVEKTKTKTGESLGLPRHFNGDGSFVTYIENYLEYFRQHTNIILHLVVKAGQIHLESEVELELASICEEALTNIIKHSKAQNAYINVVLLHSQLNVTITDDGCGFNLNRPHNDSTASLGYGITVMYERAQSVGAKLEVLSSLGKGTTIKVKVHANSHRK